MARDNGIKLAVSNPCFELWLLLHFRDSPGMQDRKQIVRLLRAQVPDYKKSVDFKSYSSVYDMAVSRSESLDKVALSANTPGCNPSTRVHHPTELIRKRD